MDSAVIVTVVVIGAIAWLAVLGVSALRSRQSEEIPSNLAPGTPDDVLETKRLERAQQAAVLLSGFLAVGIPLYYLGEPARQESFVEAFHVESVERGKAHYAEFQCANCHAADGSGGQAGFVEKRSGVTVNWAAPSINDIFNRYDRDEVRFWITYGRVNSPMPPWGLAGGGPMNPQQVDELLDYLESEEFALSQEEAVGQVEARIASALSALDSAPGSVETVILSERQAVANIERAGELEPVLADINERAQELIDLLDDGLDTDGDGVADAREVEVNQLTAEVKQVLTLPGVEELSFAADNPATNGTPDLEAAQAIVDTYRGLADEGRAPILGPFADAIQQLIDSGEGDDTDGDGLTDTAETQVGAQTTLAVGAVTDDYAAANLDPTNPETVTGVSDLDTATTVLNEINTRYTEVRLNDNNRDKFLPEKEASLAFLESASETQPWSFDLASIAASTFDGDEAKAERVVGIFQAYCARCHTSGYSAGPAFAQEAGAGGLGPALFEGRPAVQFLTDEDLADFLIAGAVPNQPYGVNGMGSGRMPGFGEVLSSEDLLDLAHWLRSGDLTGKGDS
ncbi:MAG: c-type cytochrome [Acidimicrobiia bacterium]|nr:c-type cytochrome [Acidimicrobiia bacterium]